MCKHPLRSLIVKIPFFQYVKERLARSNDKSCLHEFADCQGVTIFVRVADYKY